MLDSDATNNESELGAFARGLYEILVAIDIDRFRQYLGRWDDMLGDTSAIASQTDAEVRRTMVDLLRRPRQYGLPPWSPGLAHIEPPLPDAVDPIASDTAPLGVPEISHRDEPRAPLVMHQDEGEAMPSVAWMQFSFIEGDPGIRREAPIPRVLAGVRSTTGRREAHLPVGYVQLGLQFEGRREK